MERRFMGRELPKDTRRSTSLQWQLPESRRPSREEPVPDVSELMDDWFFGSANRDARPHDSTISTTSAGSGAGLMVMVHEEVGNSPRNSNSRLTQEWLEEAKLIVASSPSRCESPSRLIGSPRFAAAGAKDLDRRDPLSRSARRHRAGEGFSGEILSRSEKHSRNRSESFEPQRTSDISPASAVHQWFSNILKTQTLADHHKQPNSEEQQPDQTIQGKPPRLPSRKSRFHDDPSATQQRRTFTSSPARRPDDQLLSPPKNLTDESSHRRSFSLSEDRVLSPPRHLVESIQRRSISSSTCSINKVSSSRLESREKPSKEGEEAARDLNGFLKEQRSKILGISSGEINAKAKVVLSASSNSTSSMVAAICYAWLLDRRTRENKEDGRNGAVVIPVMNMRRGRMWKQRQAAWLFHHVGVNATSLLFSDEVDLENLMITRKLIIMVVGEDVLNTKGEVGSQCTILTDNYCEDAYDLLQNPTLKKLLLAGLLLDTQNLNSLAKFSMNRDAEAVQLLLVNSVPNYRNTLFDQLMQDHQDASFLESLRCNYGKPLNEDDEEKRAPVENQVSARNSTSTSNQGTRIQTTDKNNNSTKGVVRTNSQLPQSATRPKPVAVAAPTSQPEPASRGKNKFSLARWFGFGPK